MTKLDKGLVQVYTGNGKGKTTAAFGLALRASGSGLSTCIYQFAKGAPSGEIAAIRKLSNVKVMRSGSCRLIRGKPSATDKTAARVQLKRAAKGLISGKYDVVILDEVNVAMGLGLVSQEDVLELIRKRPDSVEIVLTGRNCPVAIIKKADLVTEMKDVRHPYKKGISARRGIEY